MLTPSDENECRQALTTAFATTTRWPFATRAAAGLAILAFGTLLYPALEAAEALDATVVNMRFVKPLDEELLLSIARSHDALVTVEEGCLPGGAGAAVLESLQSAQLNLPVLTLGLPDRFIEHGDPALLLSMCGLDAAGIEASIRARFPTAVAAGHLRTVANA
jgi:1-deoxy-D-xylulose-5-phosphate synthase